MRGGAGEAWIQAGAVAYHRSGYITRFSGLGWPEYWPLSRQSVRCASCGHTLRATDAVICSLDERHYKVSDIATFAFSVNTFKKGIDPFNFMSEADLEHESERLASFVEQYVPLMRDFSSYEAVVAVSKWRSDMLGGYPEKAAAALYLMGRSEEARAWLAIQLEHFRLKECSTCEPFEKFSSKLLYLIETEEVSAPAASSSAHLDARWDHLRGSYL